jgi:hypothetical protein
MKNSISIKLFTAMVFLGLCSGGITVSAQDKTTPQFGLKAGVNFSNLYASNVQNENVKVGLNAGLFARFPLTSLISLQPELLYSSKGAKETYNNMIQGSGEYRFNLNYIETPVLLVFHLTPNFNLSAGGYAAYLASANVKDMKKDGSINGVQDLKADSFQRLDYGLAGGLGIQFGKLNLGARYNYGLQNIGHSGTLAGELTKNSKNSVGTLFLGITL